ncbi:MAG: protein-arginine deiminase domain-containing protein, partial [Nannocystaceae bacterium]|nr:protein-arginine deiminase domain-containing protein [Nannocystaceae bacterium]
MRKAAMIAALALVASACGDDGGGGENEGSAGTTGAEVGSETSAGSATTDDPDSSASSTSTADTDGDTEGGAFDPEMFVLEDVFGTPNLDDDDGNERTDWLETVFEADDDISVLEVPGVPQGYTVELIAGGELDDFRLWDGETFAIGVADDATADTYSFDPGPDGSTLHVEFGAFNTQGLLVVRLLDPDGTELSTQEIRVMGSPLIMNHHLQPSEGVWVMDVDANFGTNAAMVDVFASVLGDQFDPVDDATYGFDVWVQDEIEFATAVGQGGQRLDIVIDSVRDRGLDDFPEDEFVGPSFIASRWGDPGLATTWDSFGNLEASPPVTVA